MSDESEPLVPDPVHPSEVHESAGAMATAAVNRTDDLAGKLALALHTLDGVLEAMGTDGISLDSFNTDMRGCATITRDGNHYDVRRHPREAVRT